MMLALGCKALPELSEGARGSGSLLQEHRNLVARHEYLCVAGSTTWYDGENNLK
jgi:hypothetical protein